jgi:opacity protein-like surface antigen
MKRFLSLLVVTAVALVAASAAQAFPPTHSTQTAQFTLTNPTALR